MSPPDDRIHRAEQPRLAAIHVYPFKSAAGIAVGSHTVGPTGLLWDRHWMAVDGSGRFLSQRTHPRLALLRARLDDDRLSLTTPDDDELALPFDPPAAGRPVESIHIWFQDRHALDCGPEPAAWLSDFLGTTCRIVRAAPPPDNADLAPDGKLRTGFADAEPLLLLSTASLDDLNRRLDSPVPMERFRPNLVVAGVPPYAEESWGRIRIGEVVIRGIRPCPRCAITTVDQATGTPTSEPLRTLARYRRRPDGDVPFGMNCGAEGEGALRVGATVRSA